MTEVNNKDTRTTPWRKEIGKLRLQFFGLFESKFNLNKFEDTWEFIQR